jgi:hypothetical protein
MSIGNNVKKIKLFFCPRGKISNPDSTYKYVSSFSPSPTVFYCDSQFKWGKMCIFTYFTGKQNLTYFGRQRKISVPTRTFNDEFKYVSSFSPSATFFFATAKLYGKKCVYLHISLKKK